MEWQETDHFKFASPFVFVVHIVQRFVYQMENGHRPFFSPQIHNQKPLVQRNVNGICFMLTQDFVDSISLNCFLYILWFYSPILLPLYLLLFADFILFLFYFSGFAAFLIPLSITIL